MSSKPPDNLATIDHPLTTSLQAIKEIPEDNVPPPVVMSRPKSSNDWDERLELALTQIQAKCEDLKAKHSLAANTFENRGNYLETTLIGVTLFTSIIGVITPDQYGIIVNLVKIVPFIASTLAVLNKFWKSAELASQHREVMKKYVSLHGNIFNQLSISDYSKRDQANDYMTWVLKTFQTILNQSPPIPTRVLKDWIKKKKDSSERELLDDSYTFDPTLISERNVKIPMDVIQPGLTNQKPIESRIVTQASSSDLELENGPVRQSKYNDSIRYNRSRLREPISSN